MSSYVLASGPGYTGFFADFNTTFWSGVLRITEAIVAAAPFLVAGVVTAGVLRGMVGSDRVRKILGVNHWTGPLRAWALGVLLPIDSLGALPVARELRRAGVPSGTVLSFVLVAPVLNPISIIFGLSYIAPVMLLYFAGGTFLVSVGIGVVWNRLISENRDIEPDNLETAPQGGIQRLQVVGYEASRSLVGPVFVDYVLALLAVGLLGAFLPYGVLQTGMTRDNPFAPIIMGAVAIPVYVTPVDVMMHFGMIVQDGYSLGAAFSLILLGAGANVGVANWLRRDYGGRALLLFVTMLLGATLVIGLTADRTIFEGAATTEDHTHAFDSFTRLASVDPSRVGIDWLRDRVAMSIRPDEVWSLGILFVLFASGVALKLLGISVDPLLAKNDKTDRLEPVDAGWNPTLTARQLVAAAICCVLAFATTGLYLFYPSVEVLVYDMNDIRVDLYDAVKEGDATEAERRIAQFRRQAEKLPTSILIREGTVGSRQKETLDDFLYSLNILEEQVVVGDFEQARMLAKYVEKVWLDCRMSFLEGKLPKSAARTVQQP